MIKNTELSIKGFFEYSNHVERQETNVVFHHTIIQYYKILSTPFPTNLRIYLFSLLFETKFFVKFNQKEIITTQV